MNAPNAGGWKPGTPQPPLGPAGIETTTGNRGLTLEEPLIFEIGSAETCGVDFEILPELARGGGSREATDGGGLRGLPLHHRLRRRFLSPNKLGEDKKRGGFLRPFLVFDEGFDQLRVGSAGPPLPKTRYFSLPTKPNLVTPDCLMMLSTWAERS